MFKYFIKFNSLTLFACAEMKSPSSSDLGDPERSPFSPFTFLEVRLARLPSVSDDPCAAGLISAKEMYVSYRRIIQKS